MAKIIIYQSRTVKYLISTVLNSSSQANHQPFIVAEVNDAIREGKVPPKSKMPELIPRVATALHVFNHTMGELLAGVPASPPPTQIAKSTLENATDLVHHLDSLSRKLISITLVIAYLL